jgi:hypothetical protein
VHDGAEVAILELADTGIAVVYFALLDFQMTSIDARESILDR